jgi:hypothetical protein
MQTDAEIKEEQNGTLYVQVGAQKGKMKGGGRGDTPLNYTLGLSFFVPSCCHHIKVKTVPQLLPSPQMGRGRTTTGMIIASLLYLRKMGAFPLSKGMQLSGKELDKTCLANVSNASLLTTDTAVL